MARKDHSHDDDPFENERDDENPFHHPPETLKLLVWKKGWAIAGFDPAKWRRDANRAVMNYEYYEIEGDNGWTIDHIIPLSKGGTNALSNLRPLKWDGNCL